MAPKAETAVPDTREAYDAWSDWIPYIYGPYDEAIDLFHRGVGLTLRRYLPQGRVLDAGCGVGLSSGGLLKAGFEVTGLDISPRSVEKCAPLSRDYPGMAEFVVADLMDIPEHVGGFDAAAATSAVLHHFLDEDAQLRFLGQLWKTLKPGGVLLLSTSDYRRRLEEEPDDYCTTPARRWDSRGNEFLYFQRRVWRGQPRERIYKSMYYRITEEPTVDRVVLTLKAITFEEIERLLQTTGYALVDWLDEAETGFHKTICIARKA